MALNGNEKERHSSFQIEGKERHCCFQVGRGRGMFSSSPTSLVCACIVCVCVCVFVNQLGDAGIKAMAVGLAMNSSLVSIDVESTGLSDQSVEYLLEVLLHNKSLESINLSRNSISQGCWQSVKRTLAMRTRRKSISM